MTDFKSVLLDRSSLNSILIVLLNLNPLQVRSTLTGLNSLSVRPNLSGLNSLRVRPISARSDLNSLYLRSAITAVDRGNIVTSHAAGPGSIPGRVDFLVEVFSWVFPQP